MVSFKGAQFPKDVILFAVFFFVRYTVSVRNGVTDVEEYGMQDHRLRIMHAIEINCHFAQLTYSFLLMSFATSVESLEAQKFATEPFGVHAPAKTQQGGLNKALG